MNYKMHILLALILFWSCDQHIQHDVSEATWNYLIEVDELIDLIDQPNIKILAFQSMDSYIEGHIAGAVHISRKDIENSNFPYTGMMASKTQIETLLGELGISNKDTIIVYDDNGMCEAARMWWVLHNYDFKNVRILNGGLSAWQQTNAALSKNIPVVNKVAFKLPDESSMTLYYGKNELIKAMQTTSFILDTRSNAEYSGQYKKNGATRIGRIPNSFNIDWAHSINFDGDKRFKSVDDLKKIYGRMAVEKEDLIIPYCHSGVRSAHTTFVLTQLLGFNNVKNYDGSWVEWSYFEDLPVEQNELNIKEKLQ